MRKASMKARLKQRKKHKQHLRTHLILPIIWIKQDKQTASKAKVHPIVLR